MSIISAKANVRYLLPGQDAQRLWMVPSASYIVKAEDGGTVALSPSYITVSVLKQVGGQDARNAAASEYRLYVVRTGDGTSAVQYNAGDQIPVRRTSTSAVPAALEISLRNASGVEVDHASVRIIDQGADGISPDRPVQRYKQSATQPNKPDDIGPDPLGWSKLPHGGSGNDPWWMTTAIVSGMDNRVTQDGWSEPVRISAEDGINGSHWDFMFGISTDPNTPPPSAGVSWGNAGASPKKTGSNSYDRWFDILPAVGPADYAWQTMAFVDGNGNYGEWSYPLLMTPDVEWYELVASRGDWTRYSDGSIASETRTITCTVYRHSKGMTTDVTGALSTYGLSLYFVAPVSLLNITERTYASGGVTVGASTQYVQFILKKNGSRIAISNKVVCVPAAIGERGPQGIQGPEGPIGPIGPATVMYRISPSTSQIVRKVDGTYEPSTLTIDVYRHDGDTETKMASGTNVILNSGGQRIATGTTGNPIPLTSALNNKPDAKILEPKVSGIDNPLTPFISVVDEVKGDKGDDGDDAVVYEIRLSTGQVVKGIDGVYTPNTIKADVYKTIGGNAPVLANDEFSTLPIADDAGNGIYAIHPGIVTPLTYILGSRTTKTLTVVCGTRGERATLSIVSEVQGIHGAIMRVRTLDDLMQFQSGNVAKYSAEDGEGTEWLDILYLQIGPTKFHRCKKSFYNKSLGDVGITLTNGTYGTNGYYSEYWQPAAESDFIATKLILAEKGKINNLQVDDILIEERSLIEGRPGKIAMIANSEGIHMTGTIKAQSISLAVAQPRSYEDSNGNVVIDPLVAPLNIIKVGDPNQEGMTFLLPALTPGTTRQMDVLLIKPSTANEPRSITFIGAANVYPMSKGVYMPQTGMDGNGNPISNGVPIPNSVTLNGLASIGTEGQSGSITGMYHMLGFRLADSNDTYWEIVRINDGAEAKRACGIVSPTYGRITAIPDGFNTPLNETAHLQNTNVIQTELNTNS